MMHALKRFWRGEETFSRMFWLWGMGFYQALALAWLPFLFLAWINYEGQSRALDWIAVTLHAVGAIYPPVYLYLLVRKASAQGFTIQRIAAIFIQLALGAVTLFVSVAALMLGFYQMK